MKKILFASVVGLMAFNAWDDAGAYCIRPATGFYNPNCITQAQADQLAYQQPAYSANNLAVIISTRPEDHGNASYGQVPGTGKTLERNYALGSEPRKGKPGTQSLPRGYHEVSRTVLSQSLAPRSKLTGPAVHTDPKTGAKSLKSVEITYSNSRSSGRSSTSGPGQQR